jgi:hypothetical protein
MNLKALSQGARMRANMRILPEDEPVKSRWAPARRTTPTASL